MLTVARTRRGIVRSCGFDCSVFHPTAFGQGQLSSLATCVRVHEGGFGLGKLYYLHFVFKSASKQ